jgi:peptide/nickel transport system substrate-binding protein
MDIRLLDRLRRNSSELEVAHVEAFAQGRISRRQFLTMGSVIGLSIPFMNDIMNATADSATKPKPSKVPAGIKAGGILRVANQKPSGPIDPVAMDNLGAYTVASIVMEYLCGPGEGAALAPMLATSWKPNANGSVWTFSLRKGVKWHDGKPFTSADVVATMDRLATAGLKASLAPGATRAVDPLTVEMTLLAADGNFPYLVSNWNPQSLITPVKFVKGTTVGGAASRTSTACN